MNLPDALARVAALEGQQRSIVELVTRIADQVRQLCERQHTQDAALLAIGAAVDKLGQLARMHQVLGGVVSGHDQALAALATFTQATALAFKQLYAGLHDLTAAIAEGSDLPAAPDPAALAAAAAEIAALEKLFHQPGPPENA